MFTGSMYTGLLHGILGSNITRVAITGIAVAASVMTAACGLWTIRVFFGPVGENLNEAKEASWLMIGPILVLTALGGDLRSLPDN